MATTYTRSDLLRRLPKLPPYRERLLSTSLVIGFQYEMERSGVPNSHALVDLDFRGGPHNMKYVPDTRVDLRTVNSARRRVLTFGARQRGLRRSLNVCLQGGEGHPVLIGVLGVLGGAVSAVGGILFAITTTTLSASRETQSVLAREGDEIWLIEHVGVAAGQLKHSEQFVLVDPFRKTTDRIPSAWLIHEQRRDLFVA